MKSGDKLEYTNPYTEKKFILTYTGTYREVKGCMFYFFETEKGETVFFDPCEVKEMKKL